MAGQHESQRRAGRRAFLGGLGALTTGAAAFGTFTGRAGASGGWEPQQQVPHRGSHRLIWSIETDRPQVALTFDDGPDPRLTPHVLRLLAEHGAKATFFLMGHNVLAHPELARAVVDAGHEVGNHTATHLDLSKVSSEEARREISEGTAQIEAATGQRPLWFRPPRGHLSAWSVRYAATEQQDTVMWSHSRGPLDGDARSVVAHMAAMQPGDITVLHDGIGRGTFEPGSRFADDLLARRLVELDALPRVLDDAARNGIELVTVSTLVAGERTTPAT